MKQLLFIATQSAILLFCTHAQAQLKDWHTIEFRLDYTHYRVEAGDVNFTYNKTEPDTGVVLATMESGPATTLLQFSGGIEFQITRKWIAQAKTSINLDSTGGYAVRLGLGRRIRLEQSIYLMPDLFVNFSTRFDYLGRVSMKHSDLALKETYWTGNVNGRYQVTHFSFQPGAKMLFALSKNIEMRVMFRWDIGFLNYQYLIVEGDVSPFQREQERVRLKEDDTIIKRQQEVIDKPLIRLSGASMGIGIAYRLGF